MGLFRSNDWPFSVKFGLSPVLGIIIMLILASIGIQGLSRQATSLDKIVKDDFDGLRLLSSAQTGLEAINGGLYRVLALSAAKTPNLDTAAELTKVTARLTAVTKDLRDFADHYAQKDEKPKVEDLITELQKYQGATDWVSQMLEIDFNSAVSFLVPLDGNYQHLTDALERLEMERANEVETESASSTEGARTARSLFISLTIAGAILASGIAVWITHVSVKSIRAIAGATQELAEGHNDIDIQDLARRDELGAIVASLNVFRDNQIRVISLQAEHEQSALKSEQDRRQALLTMAANFENSVGKIVAIVAAAAAELQSSAGSLTNASEVSSREGSAVNAAFDNMLQRVDQVTEVAHAMTGSIQRLGSRMAESSMIARTASTETAATANTVKELAQAAQRIGDVVQLINKIARQTNLLALNATIEAARAGDAGKGFAVVAIEVKNLATQTAEATRDIAQQVEEIQSTTASTVAAITNIQKTVSSIDMASAETAQAMEEQAKVTRDITISIKAVGSDAHAVSSSIDSANRATAETSSGAAAVLGASQDLTAQAGTLTREMREFLVKIRQS
jgi:methyl-accepting chemotaxis protein